MDASIAAILAMDGVTTGAVYALLSISLVLVFTVTRVIYIPAGEFVAWGALTMAALQTGHAPATASFTLGLGALVFALDGWAALRSRQAAGLGASLGWNLAWPLAAWALSRSPAVMGAGMTVQVLLTLAILVPSGAMLYRLCFAPLQQASVLTLLIVAVALHFALLGSGLVMFGAEGSRTQPLTDAQFSVGGLEMTGQSLAVIATSLVAMAGLAAFFGRTLTGKALRATAVNRIGAQIVGIGPARAGRLAFTMATALAVFSGVLIGPLTTVYYESGFLIGLKGFVGAIVGGLALYPVAVGGALMVGLIESFSSFWASAYKEVIVFSLILPVLAWRSLRHKGLDEEES
ncbi:MAG: ABC transporter permease [Rubrivivax sp. SCN 70-15]|nr:MAG: ABC transporter permease [Rubrivivax sp. SCN 70-15]